MSEPLSQEKLFSHIIQRLREHVDIALIWDVGDDGLLTPSLRDDGEHAIWHTVKQAIEEAGWRLNKRDALIEDTIKILKERQI